MHPAAFHMQFKNAAVFFGVLVAGSTAALAQPSQEVIDKCLKAADFEGCVNVMTGKSSKPAQPAEIKITVDQDKIRNTGNLCPSGWGYLGGGYCQEIRCMYASVAGTHDPRLGGKGWGCKYDMWHGARTLQFGGNSVRATTDERCPLTEPEIGKNRSCHNGLSESEIKSKVEIVRRPGSSGVGFGVQLEKDMFSADEFPTQISNVQDGSPAEKAGLIEGDVLKMINGIDFQEKPELVAGEAYILTVERDSDLFEVKAVAEQIEIPEGLVKVKNGEVVEVIK